MSASAKACAVDIVFVTYNSAHVIERAVKSLPADVNLIVVDNASTNSSVEVARSLGAQIIENEKNLGFGVACNQGSAIGNSEYILFLNPDAKLFEGTLHSLLLAAERLPDVGGFVPRLLRGDGSQMFRNRSFLLRKDIRDKKPFSRRILPDNDCEISIVSGAALLCRRVAFEQIGGFDENIFLYYEDDDLSVRLKQAGWKLYHVHNAVVEHLGSSSTHGKSSIDYFKGYQHSIAQAYVARKHGISLSVKKEFLLVKCKMTMANMKGQKEKAEFFRGRAAGFNFIIKNREPDALGEMPNATAS